MGLFIDFLGAVALVATCVGICMLAFRIKGPNIGTPEKKTEDNQDNKGV